MWLSEHAVSDIDFRAPEMAGDPDRPLAEGDVVLLPGGRKGRVIVGEYFWGGDGYVRVRALRDDGSESTDGAFSYDPRKLTREG